MEAPQIFEVPAVEDVPAPEKMVVPVPEKKVVTVSSNSALTFEKKPSTLVSSQYGVKPVTQAPAEKKEEAFVAPDVQEGMVVINKVFGEGTVTKIDKAKKHIRVTFKIGEKTFVFPDAFKHGFLRMK